MIIKTQEANPIEFAEILRQEGIASHIGYRILSVTTDTLSVRATDYMSPTTLPDIFYMDRRSVIGNSQVEPGDEFSVTRIYFDWINCVGDTVRDVQAIYQFGVNEED